MMDANDHVPLQDYCADLVSDARGDAFVARVRSHPMGEWQDVAECARSVGGKPFDLAAHGYDGTLIATWLVPPAETGYEFMIVFCAPAEMWSAVTFHGGRLR
jgi:hypothetical protein